LWDKGFVRVWFFQSLPGSSLLLEAAPLLLEPDLLLLKECLSLRKNRRASAFRRHYLF
jgi:hypothetical protein